jgi:hypothetical protein
VNTKSYRPPVGWLLLGLAYGVILGHWIAYRVLIPPGYEFRYGERLAFTILGFAFAGVVVAAMLERRLQRLSIHRAWMIWFSLAMVYYFVIVAPFLGRARE